MILSHLGGHNYVQNFGGRTKYLVDCAVGPEDVGAVADLRENSEGAIRCKRYMVTGGHFKVNKSLYHPSKYGAMLDNDWLEYKKTVVEKLRAEAAEITAQA